MPAGYPLQPAAAAGVPATQSAQRVLKNPILLMLSFGLAFSGIVLVRPISIFHFFYFMILWNGFIILFHRKDLPEFFQGYVVNSAFIGVYYIIQTTVFPESFGTTSPLGSWTDDSYFFSLAADNIPTGMVLRDYFYYYSEIYSTILRKLTLLPINHPMDIIFFQSGVAAMLATFTRRYALQQTGDAKLSDAAYYLTLFCPFLMANGGLVLVRDTFAAALFMYSLACINDRRWLLALAAVALQIVIRPGTALILIPAYFILNLSGLRQLTGRRAALLTIGMPVSLIVAGGVGFFFLDLSVIQKYMETISFSGREVIEAFTADPSGNQWFLWLQQLPLWQKLPLNGIYMFLYPFIGLDNAFPGGLIDARGILLNLIYPLLALWLNAWFVAGGITSVKAARNQKQLLIAFLITLVLIGTYSLQPRHKTIIQPLFYILCAIGLVRARPAERHLGYGISGVILLFQIIMTVR